MPNYVMYHCHSDYSLLDSCTKFKDYIELAKRDGMTAIGSTEHGLPRGNISKLIACQEVGLKFLYGVECYLTKSHLTKERDNYHTVLIARNYAGMQEINLAVKTSTQEDHFYYVNRLDFTEFLRLSNNVIAISACIASPLSKLPINDPYYEKLLHRYDYLEIQHHNHPDQAAYNQHLYQLSLRTGKPLIAGTDTHSSTPYKAECRDLLMLAKGKSFPDEEAFDLTYKTYDELVEAYEKQGALPKDVYLQAIENTNVMADSVESFEIDRTTKYPISYGSAEQDAERYKKRTWEMFEGKLKNGVIPKEQEPAFREALADELRVLEKIGMCGFMLSMSELLEWCHSNGIPTGPARGSVGGSRAAYVTDIIDLNPETWHTVFSRFANENRVEIGDIDTDLIDTDRPRVFEYIINKFGQRQTARVSAYGTIGDKGCIDDICRGLKNRWVIEHRPDINPKTFKDEMIPECPYKLKDADRIKGEYESNPYESRDKYADVFYYFDGMLNTIVSQSVHAAGMVISPVTLDDNYGAFWNNGEHCLFVDMDDAHEVGMCKYDFLILTNVKIINETYRAIGKPFPKSHEVNWNDQAVWRDMQKSQWGIFQMESDFAFSSLKKLKPTSIEEMALLTAALRPSGTSYRDNVFARIPNHNPTREMDDIFSDTMGYCVYQEQIIAALMKLCGFSGGEADTVRRDIAKKKPEAVKRDIIKIKEGYFRLCGKPQEEAERDVSDFIQVIDDASGYSFGYNHSIAYCLVGYLCAYCRYYHPLEFCTALLNNAHSQDDIAHGTILAKLYGIDVKPPKWGHSGENYTFDKDTNAIYQGLGSIKDLATGIGDQLHELESVAQDWFFNPHAPFVDLIAVLRNKGMGNKQIEILIKIGFFADFGNSAVLLKILENAIALKMGSLTWLAHAKLQLFGFDEKELAEYAERRTEINWRVKSGQGLLRYMEKIVRSQHIKMPSLKEELDVWKNYMGYIPSLGNNYRALMYITEEPRPLISKKTGKVWAYSLTAISLRIAETHEWTIPREMYIHNVRAGDVIQVIGGKNGYKMEEYNGIMRYYLYNYRIINDI